MHARKNFRVLLHLIGTEQLRSEGLFVMPFITSIFSLARSVHC
jgi:hypothetical protein